MGVSAVLQDERCGPISDVVYDHQGVVALCLPGVDNGAYVCARFIDPYGDTIFNPLQAAVLVEEWDRLRAAFAEKGAEKLWADIRELIVRCSHEPHVYLRFIGD